MFCMGKIIYILVLGYAGVRRNERDHRLAGDRGNESDHSIAGMGTVLI